MNKKLLGLAAAAAVSVPLVWASDEVVGLLQELTASTGLPYLEQFDSQSAFDEWTVIDANSDGYTWSWYESGGMNYRHGSARFAMNQSSGYCEDYGDDWLISPAFELSSDSLYHLSYLSRATIGMITDLDICLGQGTTAADMTESIASLSTDDYEHVWDFEFTVPTSGTWYIGYHEKSYGGKTKYTYNYSNYISEVKLDVAGSRLIPAQVSDLTQVPGAEGALSMGLTWTNPSQTLGGAALQEALQEVRIYKDGATTPVTLTDCLTPGAACSWTDPAPSAGVHTYRLTTVNAAGESYSALCCTYVGRDLPGAPAVTTTVEGTKVTLQWEAAPFGAQGGWYDASSVKYRVVRQPGSQLLASDLTATTFTDETITALNAYSYEVTAINADGTGIPAVTPTQQIGRVAEFPLIQDFEDDATNSLWTILDTNGDGEGWRVERDDRGHNAPKALVSDFWNAELESKDLLFTPAVKIEKGETYRVTFWANANLYATEQLYIYYGKDRSEAAMRYLGCGFDDITTNASYAEYSATFVAEASYSAGYIGFYAPTFTSRFWMDDIKVEHVTSNDMEVLGVDNMTTAVTVGTELSTSVRYKNAGSAQCKNFKIELVDLSGNVLASKSVARGVNAGVSNSTTLTWTPTEVGDFQYYARITFKEDNPDTQPGNNLSAVQHMDVLPLGHVAQNVGTEQNLMDKFPFPYFGQIFNETVYPASQLEGVTGRIDSMAYKVHFGHERDYYDVQFQIYMGETSRYDLSAGWIPASELQLVYDGGIDLTYGIKDLVIPFQHPYDYQGGNLVVFVVSDHDMYALSDGYGMRTYATNLGASFTRYWYKEWYAAFDPFDPDQTEGRFSDYVPNAMFYVDVNGKGAISGTVTTGGKALENARVRVDGTNGSTLTDAQGKYSLPYVNAGEQHLTVTKSGYETAHATVQVVADGSIQQDFTLDVKPQVTVSGHVVGSDNATQPLSGAEVALSLYSAYSTSTDESGDFQFDKVWGNATYLLTVSCVGYQDYTDTLQVAAVHVDLGTIVLAQEASQPATVTAAEVTGGAQVDWTLPIAAHWLKKDQTDAVGSFGGQYEYAVGQRYLPSELAAEGLADGLYITKVRFYAAAAAQFVLKVWQGVAGAESEVYSQDVQITQYDQWSEIELDTPYRIDLEKSLVVGFHVSQNSGARPVAFDYGPLMAGGDVMFDDDSNVWTTAHDLVETMAYNWLIRTYCAVAANDRPVQLAPDYGEEAQAEAARRIAIHNPADQRVEGVIRADGQQAAYGFELTDDAQRLEAAQARAARRAKAADVPDSTKPLGYNVWRLENGQEQQPELWTLLTAQPVSAFMLQDQSYASLPEGTIYRYAVRSVFTGDVMSEATFSDGLDKGRYATVSGHVTAQTASPAGAIASLENSTGYYEATVDDEGNVRFDNVYFGRYTYSIRKSYYETLQTTVLVDGHSIQLADQQLLVDARVPKVFQATDYVQNVQLSWAAPSNSQGQWLHKDGAISTTTTSIGYNSGGNIMCGQRFTPSELEPFAHSDFYVSYIAIHTYMAGRYTIRVWAGNEKNEFEIYSQPVDIETSGEWTAVRLDEPLLLDPYLSYVFGYDVDHEAGYYPAGIDDGPRVEGGDVMYYSDGWHTFYEASAAQYSVNWSIRTFITDEPAEVIDPADLETSSQRLVVGGSRRAAAREAADEAMPISYKLWRTTEAARTHSGQWTCLTPEAITATSYTDSTWPEVTDGNYYYVVKAIYNGEVESAPVYSKLLEKGQTSLVNLTVLTNNDEPATGAYVTLQNEANRYAATLRGEGSVVTIPGVYFGTYTLTIELADYQTYTAEVEIAESISDLSATLQEILYAPVGVKVKIDDDNNAVVTWHKPNTYVPSPGWFHWDNGEVYAAFSMNGSFFGVGHVYNILDQQELGMKGLTITQIRFPVLDYAVQDSDKYAPTDGTYYVKIWRGESLTEVYSQKVESYQKNAWNTITLDEPYYVDGEDYLMFGYEYTGTGYPAAIDRGPAEANKGDVGATSQGSWYPLNQAGYSYNFILHVYGEDFSEEEGAPRHARTFDGATAYDEHVESEDLQLNGDLEDLIVAPWNSALPMGQDSESLTLPNRAKAASSISYLVYRHTPSQIMENRWTKLTAEPIADTRYVDTLWSTLKDGSYVYAVKAVYASGQSKAAESDAIRLTGLETIEEVGFRFSATTRSLCITAPESGEVELYDVAGALLLQEKARVGVNTYDVSLAAGSYVLRIADRVVTFSVK